MAAYQQGVQSIGDSVTSVSVTFPVSFTVAPEIVLTNIRNLTDGTPLAIQATVTSKSSTGFSVVLSAATDGTGYELEWMAGSASIVFDVVAQLGSRVSTLSELTVLPDDDDYVPFVHKSPVVRTMILKWGTLYQAFGRKTSVPASPTDTGAASNWAVDANFFYTHDGVKWGRVPRQTANWAQTLPAHIQQGQAAITNGASSVDVTFAEAFDSTPVIVFSIQNTVAGNKLMISGMLTAASATGFTVSLNAAVDSGNYKLNWSASLP